MVRIAWLVSTALGVLSTIAWSVSFYPQVLLNIRRKSVTGFSPAFAHLNPLGFACYTAFTAALLFSAVVRAEYGQRHHGHSPQARWSDLAFGVHALLLSSFTLAQTYYYKKPSTDRLSLLTRLLLAGVVLQIAVYGVLTARIESWAWLDFVYCLATWKIVISFCKYVPQAYANYLRQSTVGWSIENILLDLSGGILSLAQLIMDSWIAEDWSAVVGNSGKLQLGLLTIAFDLVFIVQHYVLYRDRTDEAIEASEEIAEERQRLIA